MKTVSLYAVVFALAFGIGCGKKEEEVKTADEAANELFVEAAGLVSKAQAEEATDTPAAIKKYKQALMKARRIISEYKKSNLAVKLVSGEALFSGKSMIQIENTVKTLRTKGKDGIHGKAFKMMDTIGGKLFDPPNAELMVGSMAPELKVNLVSRPRSPEFLLSAQRGVRPVLLIFLSTSAPDCRELITQLKTLDTNTNPQELLILAVSKTETPETLFTSVQNLGIRFRTGTTDSDLPSPYSEAVPPSILAIDAKGILRGHAVGAEKVGKLNLTRFVENLKKHGQR